MVLHQELKQEDRKEQNNYLKAGVHLHEIELAWDSVNYKLHSASIVVTNCLLICKRHYTLANIMNKVKEQWLQLKGTWNVRAK